MKIWSRIILVALFANVLVVATVSGQRRVITPQRISSERAEREIRENRMMIDALRNKRGATASADNRRPIPALKMSAEDKRRLEPSAELKTQYSSFLKSPKTGLVHLLPNRSCNLSDQILEVKDNCRSNTIAGGGAFYSFRREKHVYPTFADLELKENNFSVAGWMTQGILVALGGRVPLEDVTLTTEGITFLADFVPATEIKEANKQLELFHYGEHQGKFEYVRSVPLNENTVYALRIIAYRRDAADETGGRAPNTSGFYPQHPLDLDKRADIIVAYRVVQKDSDGSVWLLWRELSHKKAPKLDLHEKTKN